MYKNVRRRIVAGLMAFAIILANVMLPAAPAFASNNGTLKVHKQGSPSGTEDNEPKVCAFNFEGFGFDKNQSGYIHIAGHAQTNGTYGPYSFGPTNNSGYAQTAYFNDGVGPTVADGQYKATLYGKFLGHINWLDVKAKSKVFKVDCAPVKDATASVSVTSPTCVSASIASVIGLANASLTSNGGVLDQSAGAHTATFTATAGHAFADGQTTKQVPYTIFAQLTGGQCEQQPADKKEYRVIEGSPVCTPVGQGTVPYFTEERTGTYKLVNNVWTLEWSEWTKVEGSDKTRPATTNDCPLVPVSPQTPEKYDYCYKDSDYILVPDTEGVIYRVNNVIDSGYISYEGIDLVVTAEATKGYVLSESQKEWTFGEADFTDEQCLTITKSAKVAKDTNLDGKIGIGDTLVWKITVTNTSEYDYEGFYVEVEDEGVELENDGYIYYLSAGESETLIAKTIVTEDHMRACKITNTAEFSGWRARVALLESDQLSIADNNDDVELPLAMGSATAEYVLDCTPGRGGETPETPEAPEVPTTPETPVITVLPNTSGASSQIVAVGALSLASLILLAATAIKSRLLA